MVGFYNFAPTGQVSEVTITQSPPTTTVTLNGWHFPNGHYLVTSWADSSLSVGSDGTGLIRVASNLEAPADIGVDTKRGWIAVPRFNANRIDWVAVPK